MVLLCMVMAITVLTGCASKNTSNNANGSTETTAGLEKALKSLHADLKNK